MMILVTMNEKQQVLSFKNIVALTYIFSPTLKKMVYLTKTGKESITSFHTSHLLLSF